MHPNGKDITGKRFGRLTVLELAGRDRKRNLEWGCICDCGNAAIVRGYQLRSGKTQSCGCYRRDAAIAALTKHGQASGIRPTKEYYIWSEMKRRCLNPRHREFAEYGERGIRVCKRWLRFVNFFLDMGPKPEGKSLDRKDNNGNYTPTNCRWATPKEQANNRRPRRWAVKPETLCA